MTGSYAGLMEQQRRGPAFLIRFDDVSALGELAGLVTHIESGERLRFAGLPELFRVLTACLDQSGIVLPAGEAGGQE